MREDVDTAPVLDTLFVAGHLGFAVSMGWICLRMASFLASMPEADSNPLLLGAVFWATLALWVGLTVAMLRDSRVVPPDDEDAHRAGVWEVILSEHLAISGPTAYYIGWYRPRRRNGNVHLARGAPARPLRLLDALCLLTSWGWLVVALCLGAAGALGIGLDWVSASRVFLLVCVAAFPFLLSTSFIFATALLVHAGRGGDLAAQRPTGPRNPWSWISGLRRYYLEVMRPEILARGG